MFLIFVFIYYFIYYLILILFFFLFKKIAISQYCYYQYFPKMIKRKPEIEKSIQNLFDEITNCKEKKK